MHKLISRLWNEILLGWRTFYSRYVIVDSNAKGDDRSRVSFEIQRVLAVF